MTQAQQTQADRSEMLQQAARLEDQANNLYWSLLSPSMAEQAMRDDAKDLRRKAECV